MATSAQFALFGSTVAAIESSFAVYAPLDVAYWRRALKSDPQVIGCCMPTVAPALGLAVVVVLMEVVVVF
jgi:uncharacterized protein YllA (UPF0747 family)